jgi:hypothetical protein
LNEEYKVIAMQKKVATATTVISPSSTLLPDTVAPRKVKPEIVLSLKSKGTQAYRLVRWQIDTGCPRGLICETLINKERLNQQVMR